MCPFLDTSPRWDSSEIRIGCLPITHKNAKYDLKYTPLRNVKLIL